MHDSSLNEFENLPFDDAISIYIDYLLARRDGNLKWLNKIFKKHPDLFQPETLKTAKETIIWIVEQNKNKPLYDLIHRVGFFDNSRGTNNF